MSGELGRAIFQKKSAAADDHCNHATLRTITAPQEALLAAGFGLLEEGVISQQSSPEQPDFVELFQPQPQVRRALFFQQSA